MRIALAGAGGTGKGTLGSALAAYYKIPFIPSHIKENGEMMGMSNYLDIPTKEKALAFQYAILFSQISQERALQIAGLSYISERSVYDYIPYYFEKDLTDENYINIVKQWGVQNYDAIIYLPLEFDSPDSETNTWRERDKKHQERTSRIILEELDASFNKPVIRVAGSLWDRIDQVKKFISDNKLSWV